jgi:predicted heme/steroid binding protein
MKFVIGFYVGLISFLFAIGYWVYKKIQEVDSLPELEEFTLEDLEKFNGMDNYDMKVYISIRGRVFDITEHPLFQPGEKYNSLTGHEASIGSEN